MKAPSRVGGTGAEWATPTEEAVITYAHHGEFHNDCSKRQEWICGTCKQETSISKEDLDKLTTAVDEMGKNLAKTDASISGLRVDTAAGKMADNIQIDELKTLIRNMNIRCELVEKQVHSLQAGMTTAMSEMKNTISDLESKILVLTGRQSKFDHIDISGIQDTLNNACHVIVTEMSKSLDQLVQDKAKIVLIAEDAPKQTVTGKLHLKSTITEDVPRIPQNQQKTSRLQKLANQFGI